MKTTLILFTISLLIQASFSFKTGLGWAYNATASDFPLFAAAKPTWVYNWQAYIPQGILPNLEYVAMQRTAIDIQNLDKYMNNNNASVLLCFNEPDIVTQANISAPAALWNTYGNNLTKRVRTGSPAISNSFTGIPWLQAFLP